MTQRMKLLIGYDGAAHSDAALDDLKFAGLPAETDALVVSGGETPFIQPLASHQLIEKAFAGERVASIVEHANEQAFEALTHARETAAAAAERISAMLPCWSVRALAVGGQPAEELLRHAHHWNADLIVVGSHGHSAIGRFFLGSVSLQVAREAPCSIRIGRGGEAPGRELRNLVGLDKSPEGERAVRSVLNRMWPKGTRVRIISARSPDGSERFADTGLVDHPRSEESQRAEEQIRRWTTALGIEIEAAAYDAEMEQALASEAERWDADCIYLPWNKSLMGSHGIFSSNVVSNAQCSVEIIR